MAKVGFTTKDGTVVSFTTKKRSTRKNESTAIAGRANKRKPAKRKPAARKPAKRTAVARGKDKATFKFYVVFRGPPKGLNIHAGFATQQAARAFITKKFKGTRRLQVRGRPGLVKSGHNPKVAANWKTFSLAASLKAAPAPRRRKTTTRRNTRRNPDWASLTDAELNAELDRVDGMISALEAKRASYQYGYSADLRKEVPKVNAEIMEMFKVRAPIEEERNMRAAARRRKAAAGDFATAARAGDMQSAYTAFVDFERYSPRRNTGATSRYLSEDALRRTARREREAQELVVLQAEAGEREAARRRQRGLTRKIKPVYSREYLEAKGMPRRNSGYDSPYDTFGDDLSAMSDETVKRIAKRRADEMIRLIDEHKKARTREEYVRTQTAWREAERLAIQAANEFALRQAARRNTRKGRR